MYHIWQNRLQHAHAVLTDGAGDHRDRARQSIARLLAFGINYRMHSVLPLRSTVPACISVPVDISVSAFCTIMLRGAL
jgi:hypothetical protein